MVLLVATVLVVHDAEISEGELWENFHEVRRGVFSEYLFSWVCAATTWLLISPSLLLPLWEVSCLMRRPVLGSSILIMPVEENGKTGKHWKACSTTMGR